MILGVQILGVGFALVMMYLTFVHYKRKSFGTRSMILWMMVWIAALVLVSVPTTVYGMMEALKIQRTADFFTLMGFAFFTVLTFYLYTTVKRNTKKMEALVRQLAIRGAEESEKKSKKKR